MTVYFNLLTGEQTRILSAPEVPRRMDLINIEGDQYRVSEVTWFAYNDNISAEPLVEAVLADVQVEREDSIEQLADYYYACYPNQKIQAIKGLRAGTGIGLKAAKEAIDDAETRRGL